MSMFFTIMNEAIIVPFSAIEKQYKLIFIEGCQRKLR